MCLKYASTEVKGALGENKMQTKKAIELAGSATLLASLLGITDSAVSQWGETIPEGREWQLRVLRPEWFLSGKQTLKTPLGRAQKESV